MPVLLDLFCCAGGASVGYSLAGFEVIGVDLVAQPDYPFRFHRADALRFEIPRWVDAVAASPPCKVHTALRHTATALTLFDVHEDLIPATRAKLVASGLPYVIENVVGAPLLDPTLLCGSMFGLPVRRHRLFEANWPLTGPPCRHDLQGDVVGVYGEGGADAGRAARGGGGGRKVAGREAAVALGINWTTDQTRLSQAIPPAYTRHIGTQLAGWLSRRKTA